MTTGKLEEASKSGTPGRVTFLEGRGDLPMLEISTEWSTAEIYLHGAHVTHFRKHGEPPLLFLSQCSRFAEGQAIRGGIPVIFPWFGPREGMGQHGFVRARAWELREVAPAADGSVSVRFRFPECPEAATYPPFAAEYLVTVNESLTLELVITNRSETDPLEFENCLHTYFAVDDISAVAITGLKGVTYLDKVNNFAKQMESGDTVRIASEVDRVYLDTAGPVAIEDARFGRAIRIEKDGSSSTVVWNPWSARAQQLPDFGNEEFRQMVCVESGNVASNKITLPAGGRATLKVKLSSSVLE
jgi:glucose-6-phosphate 1-epimerase